MNNINDKYTFWSEDPTVLYRDGKFLEFFPTSSMSRIEQLNSITRFCIYFFILAYLSGKSESWLQLPVMIIVCSYFLYIIFQHDKRGLTEEFYRMKGIDVESFANDSQDDVKKYANMKEDYEIEAGEFDNEGNIIYNKYQGSSDGQSNDVKYNYEEYDEYRRTTCREPTVDNPYMNPTVNDFGIEFPPEACNVDDENIQEKITDSFNDGLFRDVSDAFEIRNSQRQFYTVPNMNPPDTISFAKWLYKPEDICKVDQMKCLRYEDIRYKR